MPDRSGVSPFMNRFSRFGCQNARIEKLIGVSTRHFLIRCQTTAHFHAKVPPVSQPDGWLCMPHTSPAQIAHPPDETRGSPHTSPAYCTHAPEETRPSKILQVFWPPIREKFFFGFFHVSDDSEQLSFLPKKIFFRNFSKSQECQIGPGLTLNFR